MIERYKIVLVSIVLVLLLGICAGVWSAEDKIADLQKRISALEEQKLELEVEKENLIAEGDELSLKIDSLKMQSKSGLGLIGRYKLSRDLRKAQGLTDKIEDLEKQIFKVEVDLAGKKKELERKYDAQIDLLLGKLNGSAQAAEEGQIIQKIREYRAAKEKLKESEKDELEHLDRLDIAEIEIQEYDGPQEIREKADLINDFATKLQNRIDMLSTRADKLEVEFKTRERLGEFAEEISFFGERISREEVVSDAGKEVVSDDREDDADPLIETAVDEPIVREDTFANGGGEDMPIRGTDAARPIKTEPPVETGPIVGEEVQPPEAPDRIVLERNGVSASFAIVSLVQIKKEIELLQEQGQDLGKELALLKEKADSFYKKAEEIEKLGSPKGDQKETEK